VALVADVALTLDVEKPTAGGRMLARHNGQVVLVWGAIPGERVRARVERTGKGVLYAETIDVLSASPIAATRRPTGAAAATCSRMSAIRASLQLKSDIIRDAFSRIGRCRWPIRRPSPRRPNRAIACARACTRGMAASASCAREATSCARAGQPGRCWRQPWRGLKRGGSDCVEIG